MAAPFESGDFEAGEFLVADDLISPNALSAHWGVGTPTLLNSIRNARPNSITINLGLVTPSLSVDSVAPPVIITNLGTGVIVLDRKGYLI